MMLSSWRRMMPDRSLTPKMRALASQRDVADVDLQLVRVARDADRRIDPVDHLRQR